MKRKETYDRMAVGARLRSRRKQLNWSRRYVAEQVGVVEKYYADIERGTCGMSIETLIALAGLFGFTIDGLLYGESGGVEAFVKDRALVEKLDALPPGMKDMCRQMLVLFVNGVTAGKAV